MCLWCLFPGVYRGLNLLCRASFGRDSGSISPCSWLPISTRLFKKYSESGLLWAYICCSQSKGSHAQIVLVHFKINYFQEKALSICKLSGKIIFISVTIWNSSVSMQLKSQPPLASLFSWRIEGIEKLESLEGKSNIFLLAIERFFLECLLRGTSIQRGGKQQGSATSGACKIFGYTIYSQRAVRQAGRHLTCHRRAITQHKAQQQMETEGAWGLLWSSLPGGEDAHHGCCSFLLQQLSEWELFLFPSLVSFNLLKSSLITSAAFRPCLMLLCWGESKYFKTLAPPLRWSIT